MGVDGPLEVGLGVLESPEQALDLTGAMLEHPGDFGSGMGGGQRELAPGSVVFPGGHGDLGEGDPCSGDIRVAESEGSLVELTGRLMCVDGSGEVAGKMEPLRRLCIPGRLELTGDRHRHANVGSGVATLGEGAFLDGAPRAVSVEAMSEGEMLRLSYEGFEALSARNPALGREILMDLGRILSARLRATGEDTAGWTG